jgi:hypothetical protein
VWKGHIIITRTADGLSRAAHTLPSGVPLDYALTWTYEAEGAFDPIEQGPELPVSYNDDWQAKLEKLGIKLKQLGDPQSHPPHSRLAEAVIPGESYSAQEISDLWHKPVAEVEQWWANMDSREEPRLRYRSQSGSGPYRLSSAYDLLEFLYHYEKKVWP